LVANTFHYRFDGKTTINHFWICLINNSSFPKVEFFSKIKLASLNWYALKNFKKNNLVYFQTNHLTDIFSLLEISKNPELRNYIVKNSSFWVSNCILHKWLEKPFQNWQKEYCRTFYAPEQLKC
jgi:hypothetical protein